jgi:hypothetical protein
VPRKLHIMPSNTQVFFPKESIPVLYPNEKVGERVTTYAEKHTSTIPRHIINYHDHIKMTQPKTANYLISISEAQALVFLAHTVGAKRGKEGSILETRVSILTIHVAVLLF